MQRTIIVIILIIVALAAYLFLEAPPQKHQPSEVQGTSTSNPAPPFAKQPTLSEIPPKDEIAKAKTRELIQSLTKPTEDVALNITKADNFVTGDQLLELPNMKAEAAKVETIETANVVVNEGALSQPVTLQPSFMGSSVSNDPDITLMAQDQMVASEALSPGDKIRLKELLSNPDLAAGTVFYIHAVTPSDMQGLWGILQRGLTRNFRDGIRLSDKEGTLLTAEIPELADERLANQRSSFLGDFLYAKVNDIYIYNYRQGMLGQDPNMIKPGQQLVIVSYSEAELIAIYRHFTQS